MSKVWRNQGRAGSAVEAWAGGVSARAKISGGLVLPGTSGNYASAPDSSALSITGDIDIKVKVAMTDWTPAAEQTIVAKYGAAGQRSYSLNVQSSGIPRFVISTDGTAATALSATTATGFADGATKWLRATVDVNDGAGNRVHKFYTSDDGTTWTQLGTTVTTAGTVSIFDSTAVLETGSIATGTQQLLTGTIHRTIIQSAYDTANNTSNLVFDANFESQPDYTLSFTESSTNAAVVTINQSATSNDPKLIRAASSGGVYFSGSNANFMTAPDSAAVSITGDLDLRVYVAPDSWLPATNQTFLSKTEGGATQRSYQFWLTGGSGTLRLFYSPDGTDANFLSQTSSVATGFTDGTAAWVRATLDVDNGAGGHEVKFYTSSDGTNWTQLGTTRTGTGTTSIFDSTSLVRIGDVFPGTIYRAQIRNGIDGTIVFDANCDVITSHSQTTFTEQSSNAATVTINRSTTGRKAVAMPSTSKGGKNVWLFGTDDYLETPDNAALDIGASDSATMMVVHRHWNNFGTNDTLIAKKANTTNTTQGWFVGSGGVATGTTGNGIVTGGGLKLTGASGQYASSPDSAALSITGDIDIKVKVAMTDWTPAATSVLVAKYQTAGQYSFYFAIGTTGVLRFGHSTNGTTVITNESTVATGLVDGTTKWVRVTIDVDNGSSQRILKFYLSDDGVSWTQLGTNVTGTATSFFDGTSILEIGSLVVGLYNQLGGTVYRVIIQSAYDTANNTDSLVFDANFETQEPDTITFKETSSNAATVTVNGCYPFANAVQAQIGDGTDGMTRFTDARTAGQLSTTAFVLNRANNTITPYLNGVARNTRNITDVGDLSNSEVLRIGRLSGAGTEYLDGEVYAVGLWKRALTATEITALHNFYSGRIP